jgi:mono/diheme cytochrome c family protein
MSHLRIHRAFPLLLLALGAAPALSAPPADPAAAAMAAAVRRGDELFHGAWVQGGKACANCHGEGQNKMTASRLKGYPKYDLTWQKVVTGQQKMNQMIKVKAGGEPLVLGSEDLNALEAYLSTLR